LIFSPVILSSIICEILSYSNLEINNFLVMGIGVVLSIITAFVLWPKRDKEEVEE